MGNSIIIKPGAALDDAREIDSIIENVKNYMEELNNKINAYIPNELNTTWAENLKNNWTSYYSADIPEAMEEMKKSATNLRLAVDSALAFDQER